MLHARSLYDVGNAIASHNPYTDKAWCAVAVRIGMCLLQACSPPLKAVACDCDNTLWGGAVGELGPDGIDIASPRYRALRGWLRTQAEAGIVCSLVSKNERSDVLAAFDQCSGETMGLSLTKHIAGVRASWKHKPDVLAELAHDQSLAPECYVFVDDSPVECNAMHAKLPNIRTVQLPPPPPPPPTPSPPSSSSPGHAPVLSRVSVGRLDPTGTDVYPEITASRSRASAGTGISNDTVGSISTAYSESKELFDSFVGAHAYLQLPFKSGRRERPAHSQGAFGSSAPAQGSGSGSGASSDSLGPEQTAVDAKRTKLYQDMEQRRLARQVSSSRSAFMASLGLRIDVHAVSSGGDPLLARAAQLTLRTNQLNVAKHPISLAQMSTMVGSATAPGIERPSALASASASASATTDSIPTSSSSSSTCSPMHNCYLADVTDRFGNYGLVALAMVENASRQLSSVPTDTSADPSGLAMTGAVLDDDAVDEISSTAAAGYSSSDTRHRRSDTKCSCRTVDTFLMSCRVLERGVEHAMMRHIARGKPGLSDSTPDTTADMITGAG